MTELNADDDGGSGLTPQEAADYLAVAFPDMAEHIRHLAGCMDHVPAFRSDRTLASKPWSRTTGRQRPSAWRPSYPKNSACCRCPIASAARASLSVNLR